MLNALRRWAQSMVDRAIGEVIVRAIVVIPFLIAAGFGTAALSIRLNRELGPEMGSLILAAAFAGLGLVAALVVYLRSEPATANGEEPFEGSAEAATAPDSPDLAGVDRELLMAALTTAAPIAMPSLMRMVLRNLPLLAAVAAAAFVISRDTTPGGGALEPGE